MARLPHHLPPHHTQEEWDAIKRDVEAGIPIAVAAKTHRIGRDSIYDRIKKHNWDVPKPPPPPPPKPHPLLIAPGEPYTQHPTPDTRHTTNGDPISRMRPSPPGEAALIDGWRKVWPKGSSPNPGGRTMTQSAAIKKIKSLTVDAVEAAHAMLKSDHPLLVDKGINYILKYGLPIPKEADQDVRKMPALDFGAMTVEELDMADKAFAILEDLQRRALERQTAAEGMEAVIRPEIGSEGVSDPQVSPAPAPADDGPEIIPPGDDLPDAWD